MKTPSLASIPAALIAATVMLAAPAQAQTQASTSMSTPSSWLSRGYVGFDAGNSHFNAPCGNGLFNCDRNRTSGHLYAGSMFGSYTGVELGYIDMGKFNRGGGDTTARGINLSLVGRYPVATSFDLIGKIGTTYGRTQTSAVAGSGVTAGNDSGWGLSYGIGAAYNFTPNWSATLGWDSHDFTFAGSGRDTVRTTSLGVQYRY